MTAGQDKSSKPPLGVKASLIAYGLEHMFYDSPDQYDTLRNTLQDLLIDAGLPGIQLPETREAYRTVRSEIFQQVTQALEQTAGDDTSSVAFFWLLTWSVEMAARVALDAEFMDELLRLRKSLKDLGVDPTLSEVLQQDAKLIPTDAQDGSGSKTIRLSYLWMTVKSFMFRVSEEILKLPDDDGNKARSMTFFIESVGSLDIKKADKVQQEKVITIQNSTVNAPVTVADQIQGSLNVLRESSTDGELKRLLEELAKAVVTAARAAPPELATSMGRDMETLTKELSSDQPRREWWKLSIESLRKAATNLGEIAVPILNVTAAIMAIL